MLSPDVICVKFWKIIIRITAYVLEMATSNSVMQKAGRLTDEIVGFLKIDVIEAKDLAALDFGGTSDPYVKGKNSQVFCVYD